MINLDTLEVSNTPTLEEGVKYLATLYNENFDRFESRFVEPMTTWLSMNDKKHASKIADMYRKLFKDTKAYSYKQAFLIENTAFRAMVFSAIDVPQMIENLGAERIMVEGIELTNNVYNVVLERFEPVDLNQVYEVYRVNGSKLGINAKLYAIKCWCTSTDAEHWIWVDELPKSALSAIASTCKVYKKMLGKIRHIIRQGDVFLFEMLEKVDVQPNDEIVSLDSDTYFKLLKSQS